MINLWRRENRINFL